MMISGTEETAKIREDVMLIKDTIIAHRRKLHTFPEVAYNEFQTSQYVAAQLKLLGFDDVQEKVGGTGVVAVIRGKEPHPCYLLRADMDGLAIEEKSGLEFASKNGYSHACGHDGHMSALLGFAHILSQWKGKLRGSIKLCFQPAEEGGAGAKKMIEDPNYPVLAKEPKVDMAFGLHLYTNKEFPFLATKAGPVNANSDRFTISITGKGSHAMYPQQSVDAVMIGCQLVNTLYTITARNVDPLEQCTISVGSIHGGSSPNIISETCQITGSARSKTQEVRQIQESRIKAVCQGFETMHSCKILCDYKRNYNAIQNDEKAVELLKHSAAKLVAVTSSDFGLAGEDFSFYSLEVPSAFFLVGAAPKGSVLDNGKVVKYPLHSPQFQFDESALLLACSVWCQLIEDNLF